MRKFILFILFILLTSSLASAEMKSEIENIEFLENIVYESPNEGSIQTYYGNLEYKGYIYDYPSSVAQGTIIDSINNAKRNKFIIIGDKELIYDNVNVLGDFGRDVQVKFTVDVAAGETPMLESGLKNEVWKINGKIVEAPISISIKSEVQLSGEIAETGLNKQYSLLIVDGKHVEELIILTSTLEYREAKQDVLKAYTLYNNIPDDAKSQFSTEYTQMVSNFNRDDNNNAKHAAGQLISRISGGRECEDQLEQSEKNLSDANNTIVKLEKKLATSNMIFGFVSIISIAFAVFAFYKYIGLKNHPFMMIYGLYKRKIVFDKNRITIPQQYSGKRLGILTKLLSSDALQSIASSIDDKEKIENARERLRIYTEAMDSKLKDAKLNEKDTKKKSILK